MRAEPNLLVLAPPMVVVGDIHGQFFDLVNIMSRCGGVKGSKTTPHHSSSTAAAAAAGATRYLFLGDFVDRGNFSCEVLLYLYALKCEAPDSVFLVRGNHESLTVSSYFGFKDECEAKYGAHVFNRAVASFQAMPLAAVIDTLAGRFFCCHGGISPAFTSLAQLSEFDRFTEPGMSGFLCDLLWADPVADPDVPPSSSPADLGDFLRLEYLSNPARGCSVRFGYRAVSSFLAVNKLVAVVRAHEVQMNGYKYHFQAALAKPSGATTSMTTTTTTTTGTPPVITVFSAPDYLGKYKNRGAVLRIHDKPPSGVSVRPSAAKNGGPLYRPLELVEPIQFTRVAEPPPIEGALNMQVELEGRLADVTPYMPVTFEALFTLVRRLEATTGGAKVDLRVDRGLSSATATGVPGTPTSLTSSSSPAKNAAMAKRVSVVSSTPNSIMPPGSLFAVASGYASLPPSTTTMPSPAIATAASRFGALLSSAKSPSTFAGAFTNANAAAAAAASPSPAKKRDPVENFAAASTAMAAGEMNPQLLAEKFAKAKEKVASSAAAATSNASSQGNVLVTHTETSKGLGLGKAKRSFVQFSTRQWTNSTATSEDLEIEGAVAVADPAPDAAPDVLISFSEQEVVCLRTIFLLIDRADRGRITLDDVAAWAHADGYSRADAEYVLRAMDQADEDGEVGFDDWLVLAAVLKDFFLCEELQRLKSS